MSPCPEAHDIFKRFGKVFQQTYTRFLDLQKAEAQAREAEIELALERVRARTMAMQKSEELKEVIQLVYEQFVHLKINVDHAGFVVDYIPEGDWHFWIADKHEVPSKITHTYFESVWADQFNKAKEEGLDFFATNLNFEEKNNFYKDLFGLVPGVPEETLEFYFNCPGLAVSTTLLDNVGLYIENFSGISYSDEDNKTLMRFGKVFEQTYTRFLDLQKAEAQAREAQIEASLERIRAKAMAMHSSEDLAVTIGTFYKELESYSITPRRCGVGLIDKETHITEVSTTNTIEGGNSVEIIGKIKMYGHPVLEAVYDNWLLQKEYHPVLRGNEIKEYYQLLRPQVSFPDYPNDVVQYGYFFYFSEGGVYAWTDKEMFEDELNIYRRFTTVLSLTYKRYKDLQKAEAQAREAIKQASLDRVRGEIASMRTAEDLNRITPIIWRELTTLEVPFIRCGVFIIDEEKERTQVYLSTPDGKSLGALNLSFKANELTSNTVKHWKKKQVYKEQWNREEFINWTKSMMELGQVQNVGNLPGLFNSA